LNHAHAGGKALVPGPQRVYAPAPRPTETIAVAFMISNDDKEIAKGRVALWLDLDDLRFLACEYSRLPEDAPEALTRVWMRIAARAHAALHKSGHAPSPFRGCGDGAAQE
jgi:hypothetical protein